MEQNYPIIKQTSSQLTFANHWDHWLARWGVNRNGHRVEPGLHALGQPGPQSPVFVTANYTLSFDILRSSLRDQHAYLLVLDTQGINVWCAAGKGTFGTDELVRRIEQSGLAQVVTHRRLILPQLGAPGIAAHVVKQRSGFTVEYGPVRTEDLPAYLQTGKATPEMRTVRFPLRDRLALIPVELVFVIFPWLILAGVLGSVPTVAAILAGVVLFPLLLPWLPTHNFSTKGWILGIITALPFALQAVSRGPEITWARGAAALSAFLLIPPVTSFLALNFTGSTTFASRTGVRREIFHYIPPMAWSFGIGLVLMIGLSFLKIGG